MHVMELLVLLLVCGGSFVLSAPFNLQDQRLSAGYRARLLEAGSLLVQFCQKQGVPPEAVLSQAKTANFVLVRFVQHLHNSRKPLWLATHAVLAVQNANRAMKGQLRPAWDSISSWRLSVPVRSRIPIDLNILKALFYFAICQALKYDPSRKHIWLAFAVCLRIGFFGLLRPKEWFTLQRLSVKTPSRILLSGSRVAVITVLDAKNRAFMGRLQVRMIRDPSTIAWLTWYISGLAPSDFLWPFSPQTFSSCLANALSFYGIEHLNLTPASLRAGGATWLLEQGASLETIRFAGCWASDKAMSCYLQEAEAASVLLSLSESQQERLECALKSLRFLEQPPTVSLGCFLHGSNSRNDLSDSRRLALRASEG